MPREQGQRILAKNLAAVFSAGIESVECYPSRLHALTRLEKPRACLRTALRRNFGPASGLALSHSRESECPLDLNRR
jgi:hypothetical protein